MIQNLEERIAEEKNTPADRAIYKTVAVGRTAVGALATGAFATGARTIGIFSAGALGLGALFIGRLAVRRLLVRDFKIKRLGIEELRVERIAGLHSILHEVGIQASSRAVYRALTDTRKLAGWWTSDTRGSGSRVGDVLEFWFGDFCQKFEVVELQPGKLVRWKANQKEGMEEWAGTEVVFSLSTDKEQCWVQFSHSGWRSDSGMLPHCSAKWAVFMLSLKDLLEKGKGRPAPNDVQINHESSGSEARQSA